MKYIDILKEYDKAVVSEGLKLKEIYNSLVNEGKECTGDKVCDNKDDDSNKDEVVKEGEKCPVCGKEPCE